MTLSDSLAHYVMHNVNKDNSDLSMKEPLVLTSLCMSLDNDTPLCKRSNDDLANGCCISVRTLKVALSGLVAKGFITYLKDDTPCNTYKINCEFIYSHVATPWAASD